MPHKQPGAGNNAHPLPSSIAWRIKVELISKVGEEANFTF